ncbi:hypothetical protein LIER_07431 [Lithospermum erythrorhizon]|uniref:Uncharacterized protein n=1 Tax=Lithospermum erythrorhizon TaxID=34254 RepID=A0AAV3P8L6_LITER
MDMKHNTQDRTRVSTRAPSDLAPSDKLGASTIPNKEPAKTPKLLCMTPAPPARAHSDGPRLSPGMLNQEKDQISPDHRRRVDRGKGKAHTDKGLMNQVIATMLPPKQRAKEIILATNARGVFVRTIIPEEPSYCHGYDLTTSDRSLERSPIRENRPGHNGKVTNQSLLDHRDRDAKAQRGNRQWQKNACNTRTLDQARYRGQQ